MKKTTLIIFACLTLCYTSYSQDCSTPLIAPFTEAFENNGLIPDCWTTSYEADNTNGELWFFADASDIDNSPAHVGDGGILSGSSASNGYYAYCDASSTHGIRYLTSPMIDISSLTNPSISFYQLSDREDNINAGLTVEVWDGTAWINVAFYATNTYDNAWENRFIDISTVVITGDTQIRFVYNELGSGADDDIAIDDVSVQESPTCISPETPAVENITENSAVLSWIYNGSATTFNIEIVDVTAGSIFTGTPTETNVSNSYSAINLVPTNFYDYYVQANCTGGTSDWVGPLSFQTTILCFEPTDLVVSNVTTTSASFSWTDDTSSSLDSEVEVGVTGFEPGTGAELYAATTNTGTASYSGLTTGSIYDLYVRTNCDANGKSAWSKKTFCSAFVAPYTEDFENTALPGEEGSIPECWTNSGEEDWLFEDDGPFEVGNTGNITGATDSGGFYAAVDASGSESNAILTSPYIDVSSLTVPAISFYEVSYSGTGVNALTTVDVWDGSAWIEVGAYGSNTSGWERRIINLSSITFSGSAQVRFTYTEPISGGSDDDRAIDDVSIIELPSCLPTSVINVDSTSETEATLSWVENNGSLNWEIVIQDVGLGIPTGTGLAIIDNTYTVTSLTAGTTYEAYVRTDCGGGSFSDWTGPREFSTIPLNDDCLNAITLTVGGTYEDNPLDSTVAGATASGTIPSCGTDQGDLTAGIWYTVVVPASGNLTVQTGDDSNAEYTGFDTFDTALEVYSGTCGSLISLGCDEQIASSGTNYSQVILTGQTPNDVLYVRVWREDYSDPNKPFAISAYDESVLSLNDFKDKIMFKYYPNPVSNELNLSAKSTIDSVTIYNLLGQSVLISEPKSFESSLNMSNLQNGIYIVKVSIANTKQTIKIIKE